MRGSGRAVGRAQRVRSVCALADPPAQGIPACCLLPARALLATHQVSLVALLAAIGIGHRAVCEAGVEPRRPRRRIVRCAPAAPAKAGGGGGSTGDEVLLDAGCCRTLVQRANEQQRAAGGAVAVAGRRTRRRWCRRARTPCRRQRGRPAIRSNRGLSGGEEGAVKRVALCCRRRTFFTLLGGALQGS